MRKYSFEKLEAWQESRILVKDIYLLTEKYPVSERYGIVNQMCRSSISVSSNLAEGSSRTSNKDQAHFTQISYGSLLELLNQLILSMDLGFISEEQYLMRREHIDIISYKLSALRKYQLNNKHNLNSKR